MRNTSESARGLALIVVTTLCSPPDDKGLLSPMTRACQREDKALFSRRQNKVSPMEKIALIINNLQFP